jgi:tetratricopeptide (TPR) repeat protein
MTTRQSECRGIWVASCLLAVIAAMAPGSIQAQAAQGALQNPVGSATLQGSVRDSTGRPIAGATVYLQGKDGTQTLSALADATGSYHFSGLREGTYALRVEMSGYRQAAIGSCVLGLKEAKRLDVTLESSGVPQAQASSSGGPGAGKAGQRSPEFFDEPQFTVAGVTDGTNLGGHGSNTIVRTKESLAKDIASLGVSGEKPPATAAAASSSGDIARPGPALQDQARQHHLQGDIAEKSGDPLEAVREYQTAAELDPSEANFFDWGAELLLHRAVEPAIEVFNKGSRLFPHSARMLVALGVARYSNGSYDQAALQLCDASDLNPSDPQPYLFLGKIQSVETNQSECSVERLKRFVSLQPDSALANYYYGVNLWKRRKGPDDAESVAQAEAHLMRAVQLDSKLGVGYLQLGVLNSEGKDFSRAISSYQSAIKASPQLEEAHYRLAQAYKRTGEKAKAEEELQLYNQISKSKDEEVERERRESRQFVYTLRGAGVQSR